MLAYLYAEDGKIAITPDQDGIPGVTQTASTASQLAALFNELGITRLICSSSIDFCEDYGFERGQAEQIIDQAWKGQ